ncbi:MAG: hypothetical protein V1890_04030, partial [Candidatus Zixiibacteriota bacterium]
MRKSSKIKALVFTLFILFLPVFLSCDINNPSNSEFEPLEGKIIFSLTEGYENNQEGGNPRIM